MKYCHEKDARIVNDEREFTQGERLLYSCDGDLLFAFPTDWTDIQVMTALDFSNQAFDKGYRYGRITLASEVRRLLGMTP